MLAFLIILGCVLAGTGVRFFKNKKQDVEDNEKTEEIQTQEIEKLFSAKELACGIGAEIVEEHEDGDFVAGFQGGYFLFAGQEGSQWVDIHFYGFKECSYEHIHAVQLIVNEVNIEYGGWKSYIKVTNDESKEKSLSISMCNRFPLAGNSLRQSKELLKEALDAAFYIAHDFRNKLDNEIKKKINYNQEFFNGTFFNQKIAYMQRLKEMNHLDGMEEEFPLSTELTAEKLIGLYKQEDFGELQKLCILVDGQIEERTDKTEILQFDVREYIRKHPNATDIKSMVLIIGFENQELYVTMTKAKGSTQNTLFFILNMVRSGSELDAMMDNREAISSRTMVEIRLANAEKDYWEAKYMIDEANDKASSGKIDELTDEQRLIVACSNPSLQEDLYWAKKYYNNRCYYQALFHFSRVLHHLKTEKSDKLNTLYYEVSYYIGFIYVDLKMYDKAFYYLYMAQSQGNISSIQEFANCLCNMNDPNAKNYVGGKLGEVIEQMNKSEEEEERLMSLYLFLKRRYVYILIENGEYTDAESILNKMIEHEECVDFAKGELDFVKRQQSIQQEEKEEIQQQVTE